MSEDDDPKDGENRETGVLRRRNRRYSQPAAGLRSTNGVGPEISQLVDDERKRDSQRFLFLSRERVCEYSHCPICLSLVLLVNTATIYACVHVLVMVDDGLWWMILCST